MQKRFRKQLWEGIEQTSAPGRFATTALSNVESNEDAAGVSFSCCLMGLSDFRNSPPWAGLRFGLRRQSLAKPVIARPDHLGPRAPLAWLCSPKPRWKRLSERPEQQAQRSESTVVQV